MATASYWKHWVLKGVIECGADPLGTMLVLPLISVTCCEWWWLSKFGKEPSPERHNAGCHQVTSICEHCSVFVAFHRKIPWCLKPDFHSIRTCSTCWSCRRSLGYRHTDAVKNSYFSGASWSALQLAHLQAFSYSYFSRLITLWDSVVGPYRNVAARRCLKSFSDRI